MMMMVTMTTTIVEDDDDNESLAEIKPMTSLTLAGCQLSVNSFHHRQATIFLNSHPSHGRITPQTLILTIHVQMQPVFVVMNIIQAVQEKLNTKWKN